MGDAGNADRKEDELHKDIYLPDMNPRPLPPVHYFNWENVTEDFFKSVKELELGELLHDELFGLFEAMSAIEMMDPKMDAGMLCNRGSKCVLTYEQAVATGKLKLQGLTAAEQIGIIDCTLACLVSWLEGHSMAQTVFTNLYLHRPHEVEDRVMKAFCICIFKLIDIIRNYASRAFVYEEEDFQPMVYGYYLNPDVLDLRAIALLREVEDELKKKTKAGAENGAPAEENEAVSALYSRLMFLRLLYQSLFSLGKREQVRMPECQKLLSSCSELLPVLQRTIGLGLGADQDMDQPTMMGFEPLVNQRLLPPTFPRYTKIKSRKEALHYLESLVGRLRIACKIGGINTFHGALDFFVEFSRQGPCILSRSILQNLYLPESNKVFGSTSLIDVLRDAARAFISPPALAPRANLLNNQQAKELVDVFLMHCVRPFTNLIHLCGHNRARQRDKLAGLLEDLAALQDEAERVDAFLHSLSMKAEPPRQHLACFGTWILYHTLRIMVMYLLSGFELELYSVHEYHYIFWYLYEFLYGWLVSALTRADSFLLEQEAESQKAAAAAAAGRSARKAKPKKKHKARPYIREIALSQALQSLCGGYYKVMIAFRADAKIRLPRPELDNEQVRYEHRFAPFASLLTPPPVQYAEFVDMTSLLRYDVPSNSQNLYLSGCQHFHKARTMLEAILPSDPEIQELLKIAKTNFIVLKLLAGGHKRDSTSPPIFDFSSHPHFPIIKLF